MTWSTTRVVSVALAGLLALSGCTAAKLTGKPDLPPLPPPSTPRTVVIEPFFEDASWVQKTATEYARVFNMWGGEQDVQMIRTYAEKPLYAQVPALASEQKQLIAELHRLRPDWRVVSTGDLPAISGPVTFIRVVLGSGEIVASDRGLKSLAFGFGFVLPPLWLFEITPVTESQHLNATVQRIEADAAELRGRLLRYPTQPDFAVDTRGLLAQTVPLAAEFEYQEGLFAPEQSRVPALSEGVSQRLASVLVRVLDGTAPVAAPAQR